MARTGRLGFIILEPVTKYSAKKLISKQVTCRAKQELNSNGYLAHFWRLGGEKSSTVDTLRMRGGMMHDVKKTSNGTKMCGRHDSLTMAPTLYVAAGVSVWL